MKLKKTGSNQLLWIRKHSSIVFPLLTFAIPLVVRAIPELLMGRFLVGFDTIGYYAPNTLVYLGSGVDFWSLMASAPFLYGILMVVTGAGASIVVVLKILGPLILALLGTTVYYYSIKALSWSPIQSLVAALLSTLYFVALRISWDMLRSELALVFMFIALILLQKKEFNFRNGLLLSITMVLVVLTQQLFAVVLFAIVIVTLVVMLIRKSIARFLRVLVFVFPSTVVFLIIVYLTYFVFSQPIAGYSTEFAGGFQSLLLSSHLSFVADTLGFVVYCYLPLVPFLIFGFRKFRGNVQLNVWIGWLFVPLFLAVISPYNLVIGGVLPFRWVLLLTYPLTFYAVDGIFSIKWNWYKIGYKVAVASIIAFLSVSFLILPNSDALSYFNEYTSYIPKSMLQNTLQLSDCQDALNALEWSKTNLPSNGYLLVHQAFYGWAALTLGVDKLVPYEFGDPAMAAVTFSNSSMHPLYLVWWVNGTGWYGQPNVSSVFSEMYQSGNIAIFAYSPKN
jgi:hypothetical protein